MNKSICLFAFIICVFICPAVVHSKNIFENKFINTFILYYGGADKLDKKNVRKISNFDLIGIDRFRFHNVNGNTWRSIKKINKRSIIMLYQAGPVVLDNSDGKKIYYLNNIGRFDNPRNHPMGALNSENRDWFLENGVGSILTMNNNSSEKVLDFGEKGFRRYWVDATVNDIIDRPWKADGIKIDNCSTYRMPRKKSLDQDKAVKYPDAPSWDTALNGFVATVSREIRKHNQLVMVNRTGAGTTSGEKAWMELDSRDDAPDIVMDEGVFAVSWGKGSVFFYPAEIWLRQIEIPKKIRNSSVAYLSHTDLKPGETGNDSNGNPVSFNQIFLYSLGSYLLSKSDDPPTLFSFDFNRKEGDYKRNSWLDVYGELDLGRALGNVVKVTGRGADVYAREFEKGYVYVNPTYHQAEDIVLPEKPVSVMNIGISGVLGVGATLSEPTFSIPSHHAFFLKKRMISN